MRRSADGGSSGRIRPSDRRQFSLSRAHPARLLPARRPLGWAVALLLSGVCWWLLLFGGRQLGGTGAVLGLLALGGWGLGVLPVHGDRRGGPARGSAAQPQAARGGVEPGLLQDGAES